MTTQSLFDWLLMAHIAGGTVALIAGYTAIMVKRGGPRHRQLGRIYVYGMLAVILTGLPMSILHPNPFLFGIVIFTAYFVFTGRASALNRSGVATTGDWIAAGSLMLTSLLALAAIAWTKLAGIQHPTHELITGGVFAAIGIAFAYGDIAQLRAGPVKGVDRIIKHLGSMCGALIATTTAVAVTMFNQFPAIPSLIGWLGPTLLLTPVIIYWTRQLRTGSFRY